MAQPVDGALNGKLTRILGCTGVLNPSMEARIMRDDGTEANTDELGELWLRGDSVALGYWNNEKASKETFVDGWLHTGDKFRVDTDGNFWFVPFNLIFTHGLFIHRSSFRFADRVKVGFLAHAVKFNNYSNNPLLFVGYPQSLRDPSIPGRNRKLSPRPS